jgi:predicted transcriptional regulator
MDDKLDVKDLASLTAEITAAYIAKNQIPIDELPDLIDLIAANLRTLRQEPAEAPPPPEPVVPIKRSVRQDHLVCLLCGQQHILLKRHLTKRHAMTPDAYRALFKLNADYPLVAPDYAARRSELAKQIGFGRTRSASAAATAAPAKPQRKRRAVSADTA